MRISDWSSDVCSSDLTGVIATPAGNIRFPMTTVTCPIGTWGTAIAAIDKVAATLGRKAYDADPDAPVQLEYVRPEKSGQVDADSIHEDWSPEIAYHADRKSTRLNSSH